MPTFASVIPFHVVAQFTFRANNTSAAIIMALNNNRKILEAAFFTRLCREDRIGSLRPADDRLSEAPPVPSAPDHHEDRSRLRHATARSSPAVCLSESVRRSHLS